MPWSLAVQFRRQPRTAAFMLRALYPGFLRRRAPFPPLRASWVAHRAAGRPLVELLRLTGLNASSTLPLLYPHVVGFPLQMFVLTHPSFPRAIWSALQIRNHLLQHRPIAAGELLDFETRVSDQRTLEKGVELDLRTAVRAGPELVWESVNTFFYRGRREPAGEPSPLAVAPEVGGDVIARWRPPSGEGWRFGLLSGDLNGIHWSSAYARLFGFRQALHHPQVVLGQCLARLAAAGCDGGQRLDTWLKGPVYKGREVSLVLREQHGAATFAVFAGDPRPAIVGCWRPSSQGCRLLEDPAHEP